MDGCSVRYSAGYPEENSANCRASCRESCSPCCSAFCPANRSADSPESSLPGNSEESWESCSESYRENRLPGAFTSPTSLDQYDFSDGLRLVAGLCFSLRLGGKPERSPQPHIDQALLRRLAELVLTLAARNVSH